MEWFKKVFFPSLVEQYNNRMKQGKDFYLSEKQADIFLRYAKMSNNPNFYYEYDGYGVFYTGYSHKNPMSWRNGKAWFEKIL